MIRNTKIVATLGPASAPKIERLATARTRWNSFPARRSASTPPWTNGPAPRSGWAPATRPCPARWPRGDVLVLGDGLIELEVVSVAGTEVACRVLAGGLLGSGKGLNRRGGGLSAAALTEKDHRDLAFACAAGVDYIAVSFPASEADMHEARALIAGHGANCGLVAKLERAEAVTDPARLDAIILASDAVMLSAETAVGR